MGYTVKELARRTGLSEPTIRDAEADRRQPSLATLRMLASVLGQSVGYLARYDWLEESTLGRRIRKRRLCLGLTIVELAELLEVDKGTLREWECGISHPRPANVRHLDKLIGPVSD
jgi:transcriptional regulator with XRE-family HTH domain